MALRGSAFVITLLATAFSASIAGAAGADTPWCAPELETLPGNACVVDAARAGAPRTLVIFLHGVIEPGTTWQHDQQRGIAAAARRSSFVALMPRGRQGIGPASAKDAVAWPTSASAQASIEAELLAEWTAARKTLEARAGRPFDEVIVVGFSNGAYYATSLALRGRLRDVSGYAVFAGGGAAYLRGAAKAATARAPFFLGIATRDKTTVNDARGLARMLHELKWPARVEERPVGHAIPDGSLDRAIAWIRQRHPKP